MNTTSTTPGLDLGRGLGLLRRNWLLVLLLTALGGGAGYALAEQQAVVQTATAKVLVSSTSPRSYDEALDGAVLSSKLLRSFSSLAESGPVVDAVAARSGLGLTPAQIRGRLSARPEPSTLILLVTATDDDAATARALADTGAAVMAERIAGFEALRTTGVVAEVIDPATSSAASTTRTTLAAGGLGAGLGLVLAFLLALARAAGDRTVKTPEEAELVLGAPLLGVVPSQPRRTADPVVVNAPASGAAEAFRELRTALMLSDERESPRTVLVTSPLASEGKSAVAVNLAAALALAGERVVLVDADLRRGRIAKTLGVDGAVGVTGVVAGRSSVADALQNHRDLMGVLPAGPAAGNPAEVVGSRAMADLLEELTGLADVVVIDSPPVIPVTDAVVLASQVDAVVLVARYGRTRRGLAAEARRRLARVGADVRGCVLNDVSRSAVRGYYPDYRPLPSGQPVVVGDAWSTRPAPAQG